MIQQDLDRLSVKNVINTVIDIMKQGDRYALCNFFFGIRTSLVKKRH